MNYNNKHKSVGRLLIKRAQGRTTTKFQDFYKFFLFFSFLKFEELELT